MAVQKGIEEAKKSLCRVPLAGSTITHPVIGEAGAGRVLLKPAAPGTGVIAGGAARPILELAGVHDVVAKSLGSSNSINVAQATMAGLRALMRPDEIARRRGLSPEEITPSGVLRAYNEAERAPARAHGGGVMAEGHIGVKQVRSAIGNTPKHRGTLRALGLGRIGRTAVAAGPPRNPRHGGPGDAPRRGCARTKGQYPASRTT